MGPFGRLSRAWSHVRRYDRGRSFRLLLRPHWLDVVRHAHLRLHRNVGSRLLLLWRLVRRYIMCWGLRWTQERMSCFHRWHGSVRIFDDLSLLHHYAHTWCSGATCPWASLKWILCYVWAPGKIINDYASFCRFFSAYVATEALWWWSLTERNI